MQFTKPALPIPDLVKQMQTRGLIVPDPTEAEHYLSVIGYYRLSAYALHFQDLAHPNKNFVGHVSFDDVLNLYRFDRELRLLTLDAIERIEVALRAAINDTMSLGCRQGGDPHWYLDASNFEHWFDHQRLIDGLYGDFDYDISRPKNLLKPATKHWRRTLPAAQWPNPEKDHQEVFINHYFGKYSNPVLPPSWMILETLSMGDVSRVYSAIDDPNHRKAIASVFGMDEYLLKNRFHVLCHVRNLCAHHSRLWNRKLTIKFMQVANQHQPVLNPNDPMATDRYFAVAVHLWDFMKRIAPGTHWNAHLAALFDKYPKTPLKPMGIPTDWRLNTFWNP